jgi:membrane protein DedA with SNARE-associated domain
MAGVAGATGMPWRRFLAFNALRAAVWVGVWATAGYLVGDHLPAIEATLGRYQWYAVAALVVAVAGWLIAHRVLRRR